VSRGKDGSESSANQNMIIATRHLIFRDKGRTTDIPIRIHAPERAEVDWICRFEIGWPEGKVERWGTGVDAVQALLFALQMIGAEVYTSSQHQSGRLEWLARGRGYGFPVPDNIRDVLVGDDKRFL
jgi:uncharacterized protein DUF6968